MATRSLIPGLILALVATFLAAAPANAVEPTASEQARIEATLRDSGFVTWGDIELNDDIWFVTDAHRVDGQICDVSVDAETFDISDEDC